MFDFLKKAVSKVVEKVTKKKDSEEIKEKEEAKEDVKKTEKKEVKKTKQVGKKKEAQEKPAPKKQKKEQSKQKKNEVKRKKIEEKAKVGILKKVTSIITGKIKIEEKDIIEMLDEFEIHLIEADTALEVAEEIKEKLKKRLVNKEIEKGKLKEVVKEEMEKILLETLPETQDILKAIKESNKKPYKIVFFGPNGSGKTTTIAKIAFMLKQNNLSVVVAASDTFRAAAIEQLQIHCDKIGVKLIKGAYGADPTSIAYNAVEHAKANRIDVVLIDTAGRLEVDTNLMKELEKIVRVIKPDLKIFVAESIAGNSLYDMIKEYNEIVGMDGVILTKLDLDPKGGVILSIYKATGLPILLISKGQGYEEIEPFNKEEFVERILSE